MRCALSLFALTFLPGAAFADGPPADSIWSLEESVLAVAFAPDGKTLATGGGNQRGSAALWDAATLRRKAVLDGAGMVHAIVYSPDGKRLVTSSPRAGGPRDFTIPVVAVWDGATGKRLFQVDTDFENVFDLAFNADGKLLAVARADGVALYDGATGKRRALLKGHERAVWAVRFSPDGKTLASAGGEDGTVKLWDATTGKGLRTLTGHKGSVAALAFTPDGKTLVSGGDAGLDRTGEVRTWDTATGKQTGRWRGFDGPVVHLDFSADGKTLALAARFDGLKLREFPSGRV